MDCWYTGVPHVCVLLHGTHTVMHIIIAVLYIYTTIPVQVVLGYQSRTDFLHGCQTNNYDLIIMLE